MNVKTPSVVSSLFTGLLLALLLTAPLLALMFLAQQLVGLPFIPYDVFELVSRVLPGRVITTGIDGMVQTLGALGLSVRDTAKAAEQVLAVGLTLGLALIGGIVYFLWRRGRPADWRVGLGYAWSSGRCSGGSVRRARARPSRTVYGSFWPSLSGGWG